MAIIAIVAPSTILRQGVLGSLRSSARRRIHRSRLQEDFGVRAMPSKKAIEQFGSKN